MARSQLFQILACGGVLAISASPIWAQVPENTAPAAAPAATVVATVAEPNDFAGWMAKGRALLEAPGEGDNESQRNWDKGTTKPRQAGEAFAKAAALAPDDAGRFEAWNESGKAFYKAGFYSNAYESFAKAREYPGPTPAARAEAAYNAARNYQVYANNRPRPKVDEKDPVKLKALAKEREKTIRLETVAEYDKLLALPNVSPEMQAKALEDRAMLYSLNEMFWEAAREYEKAAPLDPAKTDHALDFAEVNVQKLPPTAQTLAAIARIYQMRMKTGRRADADPAKAAESRRYVRKQWGDALAKQNAPQRAIEVWTELVQDPDYKDRDRYDVYKLIVAQQEAGKDHEGVAATYLKASQLPTITYYQWQMAMNGRVEALAAVSKFDAARSELQRMGANPAATADDKANALTSIGNTHKLQVEALRKANGKAAIIAEQENKASQSYDAALAVPNASARARLSALVERVKLEVEGKRLDVARTQITRGYDLLQGSAEVREFMVLDAQIYGLEKQYLPAMQKLSEASAVTTLYGPGYQPSQTAQQVAINLYNLAITDKKWDDARAIVEELKKWGLLEPQYSLYKARVEIEAGNAEAARPLINGIKANLLKGADQTLYESLKAKLPATP